MRSHEATWSRERAWLRPGPAGCLVVRAADTGIIRKDRIEGFPSLNVEVQWPSNQGFPVFHDRWLMRRLKPRSVLPLRVRNPSTTNR